MNVYSYGQCFYAYFKKGFFFGVEYELANLIPYSAIINNKIVIAERAQIILIKALSMIV
jgi:hypothetical protein